MSAAASMARAARRRRWPRASAPHSSTTAAAGAERPERERPPERLLAGAGQAGQRDRRAPPAAGTRTRRRDTGSAAVEHRLREGAVDEQVVDALVGPRRDPQRQRPAGDEHGEGEQPRRASREAPPRAPARARAPRRGSGSVRAVRGEQRHEHEGHEPDDVQVEPVGRRQLDRDQDRRPERRDLAQARAVAGRTRPASASAPAAAFATSCSQPSDSTCPQTLNGDGRLAW